MIEDGRTLVVVADGARARLLEEPRLGGRLTEHAEWTADMEQGKSHGGAGRGPQGEGAVSPRDKAEHDFVAGLGRRIGAVMESERFDHLVLIASPRALGELRQSLSAAVSRRVSASEAHERVDASTDELEKILRGLRRESA